MVGSPLAVDEVRSADAPAPPARSDPRTLISWAVAAVIVTESLYALWLLSQGFFFQDDYQDFAVARQIGLNGRLFENSVFGHFIPAFNLVSYLMGSMTPYRWGVAEAIEVLLYALSLFLLYRVLRAMVGPAWWHVGLVALVGASFSLVPTMLWFAAGLQWLSAIVFSLLAILCHVHWVTGARVRWAVLGGLSIAVGLAFYDGVIVTVLFIVLLTFFVWPTGRGLAGARRTLVTNWPAWVCLGVPVALDLGWRVSHPALYSTPPVGGIWPIVQFLWLSSVQSFLPLIFGVDAWLVPGHAARVVIDAVGLVVVAAVVVATVRRRRAAARPWLVFGVVYLALETLVAATRVRTFGPGDADDLRYLTLEVFFFAIALALALRPVRRPAHGAAVVPDAAEVPGRPPPPRHAAPARGGRRVIALLTAVALVAVYGALLDFDRHRYRTVQWEFGARQFYARFSDSWPAAIAGARHPYLWDTEVNGVVESSGFYPYDTASFTVGRVRTGLTFDAWGGKGFLIDPYGTVTAAKPVTVATGTVPSPSGACVVTFSTAQTIVVPLDRDLPSTVQRFAVFSYTRSSGTTVLVGGAYRRLPRGRGTVLTSLWPDPASSVSLTVPPRATLCVTRLKVVVPEPAATVGS